MSVKTSRRIGKLAVTAGLVTAKQVNEAGRMRMGHAIYVGYAHMHERETSAGDGTRTMASGLVADTPLRQREASVALGKLRVEVKI